MGTVSDKSAEDIDAAASVAGSLAGIAEITSAEGGTASVGCENAPALNAIRRTPLMKTLFLA
ncbi:hypothetical protein MYA98_12245 [Salmonella sp. WGH-01]|nr:hypothetical protein MYA98_12245 [Salmonella sp. WGH-01]